MKIQTSLWNEKLLGEDRIGGWYSGTPMVSDQCQRNVSRFRIFRLIIRWCWWWWLSWWLLRMMIIMVVIDDCDYHGDRGDNHDHDDWESGEDSGCKDKGVDFKINITKTTHVHRITWGWRYLTLILLINNRNCNIRGSWNFKGLSYENIDFCFCK